ncbi:hypothetical protein [Flavobacterium gilvum]|uniref:Uncharacterized protein n=1 Tax=Flavobacterium gilvum TaxID=1492737 RepID=A0AAC9I4M1_9FLAO|nr:hypothetical protein [Flavobacterium gilvum]AOW09487.1 hypothetical protein EM308_08240 [Flavobacterium gilvum]KFC60848.1 hypothetical protein FEM08_04070 [Flavobacterium gilvum]
MKKVLEKLAITPEQYESMIWNFYNNWCQSVSITTREYQQVLANSSINAWFRVELTKCEKEFLMLTRHYTNPNVTPKDYSKCYADCAQKLFNIRPMALLNGIVKPKVKGVPAFNALNVN